MRQGQNVLEPKSENRIESPAVRLPLITALTALGSVSVSMYLPSLPSIAASLHASPSMVRMSLTAFLFVFAVAQTLYGPLSDRFGRKPPILCGLALYVTGSAGCALAGNATVLVEARILQALGAAAGPALGRAIARDLYLGSKLTSSLAIVAAAMALSPMLGPLAGGYLQSWFGWRSTFVVLAVAGVLLALGTMLLLPETNEHRDPSGLRLAAIAHNYKLLLGDSEYTASLLCGGLLTAGNFAWTAVAPFLFAARFGFTAPQYGNIALLVGAGYLAGTFLSGQLSLRLQAPVLVYSGLALALVSSLALLLESLLDPGYAQLTIAMAVFTAGMGIVIPMAAACALSRHPEIAGSAAGLLGSVQILTGAMGTFAAGLFPPASLPPTAVLLIVASLGAWVMGYIALKPFRSKMVSAGLANA